jgi:hypothetical protein
MIWHPDRRIIEALSSEWGRVEVDAAAAAHQPAPVPAASRVDQRSRLSHLLRSLIALFVAMLAGRRSKPPASPPAPLSPAVIAARRNVGVAAALHQASILAKG